MRNAVYIIAVLAITSSSIFLPKNANAQNGETAAIVVSDNVPGSKKSLNNLDRQPRFPGCEYIGQTEEEKNRCAEEKLTAYIREHLKFPESAKSPDFKPIIVRVRVTVDADGKIHTPRILELGVKEYDANALAVVTQMEQSGIRWVPGVFEGKAVRSPVMITVHYSWEERNRIFPTLSVAANDNDIYEISDEVPAFAQCRQKGKKDEQIRDCSLEYLADFFKNNMIYPEDALRVGLEGEISVEFVVDKNGKMKNVVLKNDLGLGCSEEVKRLFDLANEKNIAWIPGEEDGQKVNVLLKTTVRFKIKDADKPATKLTLVDPKPLFMTGKSGYEEFQNTYLKFPTGKEVSPCATGVIDVKFKINQQTGAVLVTEMVDYNALGKEFKTAVNTFLQETSSYWRVQFPGLGDETQYYLALPFVNNTATCSEGHKGYKDLIYKTINEYVAFNDKKMTFDSVLESLDKAVRLYPADNKIRYMRGVMLYRNGRTVEGCVDLFFVNKQNKEIAVPASCK
ncbi:MAG: hypothetical protein OHK0019_16260 [Saprospiraceae bacterium]